MRRFSPRSPMTPRSGISPNGSPSTHALMQEMRSESAELQALFNSKMDSSPQAPGDRDNDVGVGILLGFWGQG